MNNKVIGSIFIVSGISIGAGMLAIPLVSSSIGFFWAAIVLVSLWFLSFFTAHLLIDVYKHVDNSEGFHSLSKKFLGNAGSTATFLLIGLLLYALSCAYISAGGDVITQFIEYKFTHAPNYIGALFFCVIGAILVFAGTRWVDISNRIFLISKLLFLAISIVILIPTVQTDYLITKMPVQGNLILLSIPIIFTSFGFHNCIPSITQYLGKYNRKKLNTIFFIGSIIPLFIYLLWELVILGSMHPEILKALKTPNDLLVTITKIHNSKIINTCISIFITIAPATSFLGISLSLFDYIEDILRKGTEKKSSTRLISLLLTFLPPFIISIIFPKIFIYALGVASLSCAYLMIFLPIMLYLRVHKTFEPNIKISLYNKIFMALALLVGFVIVYLQIKQIIEMF